MNAAVITPAETVAEAHAVLHVAMENPDRSKAATEIIALADALETYRELDTDALHWECAYPHLRDEADPDGEALRKAAEEVGAAAEDLIQVMAAHSGTEDEMNVAGGM